VYFNVHLRTTPKKSDSNLSSYMFDRLYKTKLVEYNIFYQNRPIFTLFILFLFWDCDHYLYQVLNKWFYL